MLHSRESRSDRYGRGFTLIELLVVIAIIGLLSSIVLTSVNAARTKAYYAKAASDASNAQVALQLYYDDNRDWPPVGDSIAADTSDDYNAWNRFIQSVGPYLGSLAVVGFPTVKTGNALVQGYSYAKGTESSPVSFYTYNGKTGQFVACIVVYDGYWLDFILPEQSKLTTDDGGIDPDGIEKFDGHYVITYNKADCGAP